MVLHKKLGPAQNILRQGIRPPKCFLSICSTELEKLRDIVMFIVCTINVIVNDIVKSFLASVLQKTKLSTFCHNGEKLV